MNGSDIQIEKGGFTRIHNAILEKLGHEDTRLTGRQLRLLLTILRLTYGYNRKEAAISIADFCAITGMGKGHVSESLSKLVERKIIKRTGGLGRGNVAVYAFNKYHEGWDTKDDDDGKVPESVTFGDIKVPETVTIKVPESGTIEAVKVPVLDNKGSRKALVKVPPSPHTREVKTVKTITTKTKEAPTARAAPKLTDHPAVQAYHVHFPKLWPSERQSQEICAVVVDIELWDQAMDKWELAGNRPTNVDGMLDWYKYPERMQRNGSAPARTGARSFAQQSMDNVNRVLGFNTGASDGEHNYTNGQPNDPQNVIRGFLGAAG